MRPDMNGRKKTIFLIQMTAMGILNPSLKVAGLTRKNNRRIWEMIRGFSMNGPWLRRLKGKTQ
jgi:hypothetical protein